MALCLEVMGTLRFPIALLRKKGADLFFYYCGRFGPLILPENKPCFFICAALILLA